MFSPIILLIAAAFGLVSLLVIRGKHIKNNNLVNKYLVIILVLISLRLFSHGVKQLNPAWKINDLVSLMDLNIAIFMPCLYLYFRDMVYEKEITNVPFIHFITPAILLSIFIISYFLPYSGMKLARKFFFVITIISFFAYYTAALFLLYKNVWYRKSDLKTVQKQNNIIKNWSIFLYVFLFLNLLTTFITSTILGRIEFNNNYLWITATLWICVFLKIILTPEILYGYNFLNPGIEEVSKLPIIPGIWSIETLIEKYTNVKDEKLSEKIRPMLKAYIQQVEQLSSQRQIFRAPEISLPDLSVALQIPLSHIVYLFKYHCKASFNDYKKTVRIQEAIKLIESGFLKTNTVDALASEVGFTSKNTFYISFKSITGLTTQDYIKRL